MSTTTTPVRTLDQVPAIGETVTDLRGTQWTVTGSFAVPFSTGPFSGPKGTGGYDLVTVDRECQDWLHGHDRCTDLLRLDQLADPAKGPAPRPAVRAFAWYIEKTTGRRTSLASYYTRDDQHVRAWATLSGDWTIRLYRGAIGGVLIRETREPDEAAARALARSWWEAAEAVAVPAPFLA
jgi:hypothetical protein